MANRYWVGASSNLWNDAANWSATSGGAGGASVPTMNDDIFFDAGSTRDCLHNVKDGKSCRNMKIQAGFVHKISITLSYTLYVYGNFECHVGSALFDNLGEIEFVGSTNTTLYAVDLPSNTRFHMIFNKSGGAKVTLLRDLTMLQDSSSIPITSIFQNSLDTGGYRLRTPSLEVTGTTSADITFLGSDSPRTSLSRRSNSTLSGDVEIMRGASILPGAGMTITFSGGLEFVDGPGTRTTYIGEGTIARSSGVVMARHSRVVGSTASGGALFRAPADLGNIDEGGNTGWDFSNSKQTLSAAGTSHQHYADSADITVASTLVVAGSHHGTSSQSPGMTMNATVVAENSSVSVSSASSVALVQKHTLSVSGASSATSVDSIAISQQHLLTPSDSASGTTSGVVTLSQMHSLATASAVHDVTSDNLHFSGELFIGVHDSIVYQAAQAASIVQAHTVAVSSSVHGLASDELSATENRTLLANSTGHTLGSQLDKLLQQHLLSSQSTSHALRSDNVILTEFYRLIAHSTSHGLTGSNVDIDQYLLLNKPDDSVIGIASPEIWLVSEHFLQMDGSRHRLSSVDVSIVNWDELGVGFGRYREKYKGSGGLGDVQVPVGRLRERYKGQGELGDVIIPTGRLREKYKSSGRLK